VNLLIFIIAPGANVYVCKWWDTVLGVDINTVQWFLNQHTADSLFYHSLIYYLLIHYSHSIFYQSFAASLFAESTTLIFYFSIKSDPGDDAFAMSLSNRAGGRIRAWRQILNLHNGTFIARFRLYDYSGDLTISVTHKGKHVANSPYEMKGKFVIFIWFIAFLHLGTVQVPINIFGKKKKCNGKQTIRYTYRSSTVIFFFKWLCHQFLSLDGMMLVTAG